VVTIALRSPAAMKMGARGAQDFVACGHDRNALTEGDENGGPRRAAPRIS
jgi:hypothetical protein